MRGTAIRWLAMLAGGVGAVPVTALMVCAFDTPITASGALYLGGSALVAIGAASAPWRRRRYRGVARLGLGLLAATALARAALTPFSASLWLTTLAQPPHTPWLDRLVDEQDVALFGARVLQRTGMFITPREAADVVPALHAAYAAMRRRDGRTASPFPRTYLGLQRPAQFDLVLAEPATDTPRTAVIFLHGFSGNFTVQCWLVAEAARAVDAVTACPSVGWAGDWWSAQGAATVRATIEALHARGITRIYLAGLSNGGVGASRLAAELRGDIAGLILISGADPAAAESALPLLILQGAADERMPPSEARAVAAAAGDRALYHELAGDHFVLAKRTAEVRAIIADWLAACERAAP